MKKVFVVALAVMALVAMSATAWAQATEPGPSAVLSGRIITDLGYQGLSKEQTTNKKDDVTTAFINVTSSSYLRGTWTSADKTTGGLVELSVSASAGDTEAASLRYAYGWWKVGNCMLLAGQTDSWVGAIGYAPMQYFGLTQGNSKNALANFGFLMSARDPMIRFEYRVGDLGFSIAAVQPSGEQIVTPSSSSDMYATLPRFDLAMEWKAGGFMTTPGFGWSQLKYQGVSTGVDDSYTSWVVALPMKYTVGPFTAKLQLHTGANTEIEWDGEYHSNMRSAPKIIPVWSGGREFDTTEAGGVLALEYVIGNLTLTGGYGQVKISNDLWTSKNGYKSGDYTRSAWFIALPYTVTKNFTVQPELSYYNFGDSPTTNADMGNEWLAGVQFKFVF